MNLKFDYTTLIVVNAIAKYGQFDKSLARWRF
jgi:hypothetical protein